MGRSPFVQVVASRQTGQFKAVEYLSRTRREKYDDGTGAGTAGTVPGSLPRGEDIAYS